MDAKALIRDYASKELLNGQLDIKLDDHTELIENGLIDSIAIIKLLAYLEETFSIEIEQQNLVPDNFESIESISQMVIRMTEKN